MYDLTQTPQPPEYPFVNFKSTSTEVGGLDTRIFGRDTACIIDSIWAGNQSNSDLMLNIYLMKNEETESKKFMLVSKWPFKAYEAFELIQHSVLYLEPGDLLFAFTDFSETHLTITISYRTLMNQSMTSFTEPTKDKSEDNHAE
jgi:hypothetical protein